MLARRLVGEAGAEERPEEPIAGAVPSEDAAGAVAAVRGGGQADDYEPGVWVPEAGDGASPVALPAERSPLLARHPLPPLDEARAPTGGDDGCNEPFEGVRLRISP